MPIELESAKVVIMDYLTAKTGAKSKFYFNDFTKLFPDAKAREVKKVLTALVKEEKVEYWSSGSTTMYGMAGAGKQGGAEGE
ncbi:dissimilatory sulfite reductase D family protein [Maridesulfovibrio zosterae]|uniref:dissimilatory sulfite reductase D family protein n=1 Tax=Maridesulfovibrio zosterae TaxID=82171 RepID=UPI0003F95506|nr:dissimilatory sulfite reductase D family protein [Maridesulfovibrio zosterae]